MDDDLFSSADTQLSRRDSFEKPLADFKRRLTDDAKLSFRNVTAQDVHVELVRIQRHHEADKTMQNFARVAPFLEGMSQLEKVVSKTGAQHDVLAFLWGPMKQIFRVGHLEAQSNLVLSSITSAESSNLDCE
jgi:hypothetical protein